MKFIEHGPQLYSIQLNQNLVELYQSCEFAQSTLKKKFNIENYSGYNNGPSQFFSKYNLFLFPIKGFHKLYYSLRDVFHQLVDDETNFYIQCWLNYYNKNENIGWHNHWPPEKNAWHGFFCVNVEPDSRTTYRWLDKNLYVNVESKNNLLVIGKSNGDQHRSSKWEHNEPRITIAFDIVPMENIPDAPLNEIIIPNPNGYDDFLLNHWIPI